MAKLDQEKVDFARDMQKYEEDLKWIKQLDDYQQAVKHGGKITGLKDNLEKAKERLQSFQERETLFNIEVPHLGPDKFNVELLHAAACVLRIAAQLGRRFARPCYEVERYFQHLQDPRLVVYRQLRLYYCIKKHLH